MIYTEQTVKALKLCFVAHKEQTDKTGVPYVFHPFHLAEQMTDELTAAAALLHDCGKHEQYENGILHEQASARIAPEILKLTDTLLQ